MTPRPILHAFVDEAGVRARSASSSDHFVMSAVLIPDNRLPESVSFLAKLRQDTGRAPGQVLHFRKFGHAEKVHVAQEIGSKGWLLLSNVIVCKPSLTGQTLDDDKAYLYTFRLLLERLSWIARDLGYELKYTLAHIVRFQIAKLRQYESILRTLPDCKIAWASVDARGGSIDQPNRIEQLQLADSVASATFAAFEQDKYGNTETRYLQALSPRLYRRAGSPLTSYGLKIFPWDGTTKAAYPWAAAL